MWQLNRLCVVRMRIHNRRSCAVVRLQRAKPRIRVSRTVRKSGADADCRFVAGAEGKGGARIGRYHEIGEHLQLASQVGVDAVLTLRPIRLARILRRKKIHRLSHPRVPLMSPQRRRVSWRRRWGARAHGRGRRTTLHWQRAEKVLKKLIGTPAARAQCGCTVARTHGGHPSGHVATTTTTTTRAIYKLWGKVRYGTVCTVQGGGWRLLWHEFPPPAGVVVA